MSIQLLSHLFLLTKNTEYIVTTLTHDDTYYYLNTAWNHKFLGYPSFDCINNTNGFHFLWYIFLLAVSYLVTSAQSLLPLAIGICSLFIALPYIFFVCIGRQFQVPFLSYTLSFLWFAALMGPRSNINGMENSLHLLVSCWVLYEVLLFFNALTVNKRPSLVRLSLSLVANAWSRFDSGLYSAVVFVICIGSLIHHCWNRRNFLITYGRTLSGCVIIAVTAAAIQFAAYWSWGRTLMPLSGIIKMYEIFPDSGYTLGSKAVAVFSSSLPNLNLPKRLYPLLTIAMIFCSFYMLKNFTLETQRKVLSKTFFTLLAASVVYTVYVWLSPSENFTYWYFSAVRVYWIFTITFALYVICYVSSFAHANWSKRLFIYAVWIICFTKGLHSYYIGLNYNADDDSLFSVRYRAAQWVAENIPKDDILAAWNAGQLGFFSGHRVINLDGLVNNKQYFESVLQGNVSLFQYLIDNKVKYLVDYYDYTQDKFTKYLSVVQEFPVRGVRGGGPIRIWNIGSISKNADIGYYPKNDKTQLY